MQLYGEYVRQTLVQISIAVYMAAFLMVFYYFTFNMEAFSMEEDELFPYQSRPVTQEVYDCVR